MKKVKTVRKVLIVFTDPHLSYSPTTLNLYDSLKETFDVTILAFAPNPNYSSHRILDKKVKYINAPVINQGVPLLKRLGREVSKTLHTKNSSAKTLLNQNAKELIREVREFNGEIIAVDFFALWCAQQAGKEAHLVSLEIQDYDPYRNACNLKQVKSVIIQSIERYNFLFPEINLKHFFVQNAPVFIDSDLKIEIREPKKLIFCGSAVPWFGIISCLEFISDYPEFTLTVKGAVPVFVRKVINESFGALLHNGSLILDETYLGVRELNDFLSDFYIGFVFYDIYRYDNMNSFNYLTAPSGKLFQYYNAGLPVVANNLSGLKSVAEFKAGILLDSLGSKTIAKAIGQIKEDYELYALGAHKAAAHFDFKKSVAPFLNFLETQV